MASVTTQIQDAIVAALKDHTFSLPLGVVERSYLARYQLGATDLIHVPVVISTRENTRASRQARQRDHAFDVGVMQRVAEGDDRRLDDLTALTEEIEDFLSTTTLTVGGRSLQCLIVTVPTPYSQEFLEDRGQFTAVLTATYRRFA